MDLGIILPETLNMTIEERKKMLNGYTSFYEKLADANNAKLKEFYDFIIKNERRPDINSTNESEKALAQQFKEMLPRFKQKQIPYIVNVFDKYGIKYEPYEKAILNKRVNQEDLNSIILTGKAYNDVHGELPEHLKKAIELITIKYTFKRGEELFEILDKNDEILKQKRAQVEQARYDKLMKMVDILNQNVDIPEKQLLVMLRKDFDYDEMSKGDQFVIKSRYSELKKNQLQGIIKCEETSDVGTFCKKIRNGNAQFLQGFEKALRDDIEINNTMKNVLEYMITHNGKAPDINSENMEEQQLAKKLNEYKENGKLDSRFDIISGEMESSLYNPGKILYDIITKNYDNAKGKQTVLKCVQFFQKNNRRPLNNSADENERNLANEFQENCVSSFTSEQIAGVNRLFNSRTSLKNACSQYIKNLKSNEERDEK